MEIYNKFVLQSCQSYLGTFHDRTLSRVSNDLHSSKLSDSVRKESITQNRSVMPFCAEQLQRSPLHWKASTECEHTLIFNLNVLRRYDVILQNGDITWQKVTSAFLRDAVEMGSKVRKNLQASPLVNNCWRTCFARYCPKTTHPKLATEWEKMNKNRISAS